MTRKPLEPRDNASSMQLMYLVAEMVTLGKYHDGLAGLDTGDALTRVFHPRRDAAA
jgi:hypothetical protein